MFELTIIRQGAQSRIRFSEPAPLDSLLARAGELIHRPCGGHGSCGKCAVELSGQVSEPSQAEKAAGCRLACQAVVLGDARVTLPDMEGAMRVELSGATQVRPLRPMAGKTGAAVDIGTTTIAVIAFSLQTGALLGSAGAVNPQTSHAADVMGRIEAALGGKLDTLRRQAAECVRSLVLQAAGGTMPEALVITGNTTMLYLLCGLSPEGMSHAPFTAGELFGREWELDGIPAYLPPCMNAFVGADVTCAVLASGMCGRGDTSLLCDVGTNGELALWREGTLYVASTAAGPAFEGAGIRMGCGSVPGAIDRVWTEGGGLCFSTIGGLEPVGICGSGLIDAVAAGLELGLIDETGALEGELCLGRVTLCQEDIRAVQLAKAAIAAGIEALLSSAGAALDQVEHFYITGGFGSHLELASAISIGLLPAGIEDRAQALGNAALAGACLVLMDRGRVEELERIAGSSRRVELGGDPVFNQSYVENMLF